MATKSWKIHKFGGTSLSDEDCFRRVASIVESRASDNLGVVVSAMGGMTDQLLQLCHSAGQSNDALDAGLDAIGGRYSTTVNKLVDAAAADALLSQWQADCASIRDLLDEAKAPTQDTTRIADVVAGFGELWSARLLAALLKKTLGPARGGAWLDARELIVVRDSGLGPAVLWDQSRANWQRLVEREFDGVIVITGFIASDEEGRQTTLGRNGSDHSAAVVAALSEAAELTVWTDVDGVMSADPNKVPDAEIIQSLTYNEAMELAYFGAKVIHPQTMGPAVQNNIPVLIRNTFNPEHEGSRIADTAPGSAQIKGITAINDMALVNLEGAGMIGVPGTADRMFAALNKAGVSVTLISQASSEHSICIAVPDRLAPRASQVIREAFAEELANGQIQSVDVTPAQSVVAVVGDEMAGTPGIAARFFDNLASARINIRAIAQGSSERNISVVVDAEDSTRAIRAAHSGFYLSAKTISVGLIGPGTVGATLLEQIREQSERLASEFNIDLRVRAIARSRTMLLEDRRISLDEWRERTEESTTALDLDKFEAHVNADHLPHAVIIDCTASETVADRYADWLRQGIHIVTPNKKAFSGPRARCREIAVAAHEGAAHYFYETTVGAALPIIRTLRDLVDTGDTVRSVQGILSGTLAYLFNVYDGTVPFSQIVREARDNGFTEPDPRDDLSGMDVARKLTILARELGQPIELGDFDVQSLVPEALRDVTIDEYLERLPEFDGELQTLFEQASAEEMKLRYIAELDADGKASVRLRKVASDSAFGNIDLTDNIVRFSSDRYAANPLVVQGPGAGPSVTAGGIFSDVLHLARLLGGGEPR